MVATSGAKLLADDALEAMRSRLLPMATVLTPNIPEAELLLDERITDAAAAERALERLRAMGPVAVLLKGGHLEEGPWVVDRYAGDDGCCRFEHARIPVEGHGTGCTLASAIAANLARGLDPRAACEAATHYVAAALAGASRPGRGNVAVLDHFPYGPAAPPTTRSPSITPRPGAGSK
jgi:hydroxymethylpyrimidine/phosphomethylpyrimidine kinase